MFALYTGCQLQITPMPPLVLPTCIPPLPLLGTASKTLIGTMPACVEGDELPVMIKTPATVPYIFGPFVGGMGHIELMGPQLPPDFYAKGTSGDKKLLRLGGGGSGQCQLMFCVDVPGMNPAGVPDAMLKKPIMGAYLPPALQVQVPM